MNAGIHDAVGLAWRLAMALAGAAGPEVLASYSLERQRAHAELDDQQARGFRQLMYRNPVEDLLLKGAVTVVPDLASKIFGGSDMDQLGVAYPDSPLSSDELSHLRADRRIAPAGHRAPDAPVVDEQGRRVALFDQIYNPDGHSWGWSLLAFDGGQASAHPLLLAAASAVALPDWVHPRLVVADPAAAAEPAPAVARLFDLDLHAHTAYGLQDTPALVLIRPDGHIAFRGSVEDAKDLQRHLQHLSGADAPEPDAPRTRRNPRRTTNAHQPGRGTR